MTKQNSPFVQVTTRGSSFKRDTRLPNVLLLLLDDCGSDFISNYQAWHLSALGYDASTIVDYPTLSEFQAIKQAGVRFMNARAMPNCSPTRACILSGRYGFRTGIGTVTVPSTQDPSLPAWEFGVNHATDELILHRLIAPPGYRGLVCGKWHLGMPDGGAVPNGIPWDVETVPAAYGNGWNHLELIRQADPSMDYRCSWANLDRTPQPPDFGSTKPGYYNFYWNENGTIQRVTEYHTTWSRQRLQDWILAQKQPWIAYWAVSAIHSPFGAFPNNGAGYSGCMPPDGLTRKAYSYYNNLLGTYPAVASTRAALEAIDIELQNLREAMGASEWDNTLVIVMGDNGTPYPVLQDMLAYEGTRGSTIGSPYSTMIASGGVFKGSVYEAGVRVPLLVKGPMVKSPNRDYWGLVDPVDIFSTIREACRAPLTGPIPSDRTVDGISWLPALVDTGWADNAAARSQSFGELFSPLGDPSNATDTTLGHVRDRWLIQRRDGEGVYKLIRKRSGTSNVDEFYRLAEDDLSTQDDPMERSPLPASGSIYVSMATALTALLNSEGDIA